MKVAYNEIIGTKEALIKLQCTPLPVRASLSVAQLTRKVNDAMQDFATTRDSLQKKYSVRFETNKENNQVNFISEIDGNALKFAEELNELLKQEVELVFTKIKLPEKISSTCDACKHNMEKAFEIEPSIMLALEKFVEIT